MRNTRVLTLAVLLSTAGFATATQPPPPPAEGAPVQEPSVKLPPELARVLTDYETAWRVKDASALAVLFAEDGFVLPGGRPPVRGRAAIQKHYTGMGGPLYLRAFASVTDGSAGYILGGYTGKEGGPDEGKFTLTLKKVSGRWLIMSDMDNYNSRPRTPPVPPPAPPPA